MQVIYEDNHIIAINKSSSEIVQGDKTGDQPLSEKVKAYIKNKYNKPGEVYLGVTHRLDRPTSGVIIFARTSKALTRLNEMFKSKKNLKKVYWAVVDQKPPKVSDTITHWLVRNQKQNKSYSYSQPTKEAKEATLSYRLVENSDRYFLLEIDLHTGRHHQIRAQLAAIGCKIKGDVKYGFSRPNNDGSIHLHARKLEFEHPVSKKFISLVAKTPNDPIWNFFDK